MFQSFVEYTNKELLDTDLIDYVSEKDKKLFNDSLDSVIEGELKNIEFSLITKRNKIIRLK